MSYRPGDMVFAPVEGDKPHRAVVIDVVDEPEPRVRVVRGTSNAARRTDVDFQAVCGEFGPPDSIYAKEMRLEENTFFHADEAKWFHPSQLRRRKGRCPDDVRERIIKMVEEYDDGRSSDEGDSDDP